VFKSKNFIRVFRLEQLKGLIDCMSGNFDPKRSLAKEVFVGISKKVVVFVFVGLLVLAQGLHAKEPLYTEDNPASKLGRGVTNVVFSPGEYIVQTAKLMENHDPVTAYFGGIFQGAWHMVERIGGGIYEIVTFPVPVPKKYESLMDPPTTVAALQEKDLLKAN